MGKIMCSVNGYLDDSKFSKPMPWIGIYVTAASLAIAVAMALDAFRAFRYKKFWFPCKFFSLNATTLTLIGVAVKLSVDLNTPMPSRDDQLAKLSSSVLICTIIGNSMPSLGIMENQEIMMNIIALGILVVTVIVNISIQLATGAIYLFWKEHILTMFLMLLLFLFLSFSALTVPVTKRYFEFKYSNKYEMARKEACKDMSVAAVTRLRDDLRKYWMMAQTCCPQFVMGRSVTCTASGAICLLSAATLAQAVIRSYCTAQQTTNDFCRGESDYKWSVSLILFTQVAAVTVGTIAPALRWFLAINYRCRTRIIRSGNELLKVESYWLQTLLEAKDCPLVFKIKSPYGRKLAHRVKTRFLDLCIGIQTMIVVVSKFVRYASIFCVGHFLWFITRFNELRKRTLSSANNSIENHVSEPSPSQSQSSSKLDLSRFVLYLDGEEELVHVMMRNNCDATDHSIRLGKKKQPKFLMQLLEISTRSLGFTGVREFDGPHVPSLENVEPPNCWALPIVTLTSIAVALPNVSMSSKKQLINGVNEGLVYVRLIEDNLESRQDLKRARTAADIVWQGVDLYGKWLDIDLYKMASQEKSVKDILEELVTAGRTYFKNLKAKDMKECLLDEPAKWPVKVLAANSMYRLSQVVLLGLGHTGNNQIQTNEILFERLSIRIADIIGACLTNLQHIISVECFRSNIEEREEGVRNAISLLGKTEKILKFLDRKNLPSSAPCHMTSCIDVWQSSEKHQKPSMQASYPSTDSLPSNDVCLIVD
ncbi:unnamed protein product [Rhodiola kirilowii]